MVKLLYITNGISGAGGLERVLSIKGSALAEDGGFEVHILSLNEEGKETFYPFSAQIHWHHLSVSGNPFQYIKDYCSGVRKKVAEIQPDLVSVCDDGLKGFFLPKILRKKIPMIYERHASVQLNNSVIRHKLMRWLVSDFQKMVLLTESNKLEWPAGNLEVIPNPLSFYPTASSTVENNKIIAVGSHSSNKGYDRLLQVWQIVSSRYPEWSLEIYGKSAPNKHFEELAATMGLRHIFFNAPVSHIQEKYLQSDILVLPSRSEGFGMVLIEAMSCGVPVVSFNCSHGPADIITHGEDGYLIENGDIEAFSAHLEKLISKVELRKEMGRRGKENVKKYLPKEIVKEWEVLFRNLIEQEKENPNPLPQP